MKRLGLIALLLFLAASSFAQIPLKGTWNIKMSFMGNTATNTLTFDDDSCGRVSDEAFASIKMNFGGVKLFGSVACSISGTFVLDGTTLTIKWDKDTYNEDVVPVTATVQGEPNADLQNETQGELDAMLADLRSDLDGDEVYTGVKIKNGKLWLTCKGDSGKEETDKYSRVK